MNVISKLIPAIALIVTAVCAGATTPERIYHDSCCNLPDTMVMIPLAESPCLSKSLEIRGTCAPEGRKNADMKSAYGIAWNLTGDPSVPYYRAMLSPVADTGRDAVSEQRGVELVIQRVSPAANATSTISRHVLSDDIETLRCDNSLAVEIDCRSGEATMLAGDKDLKTISSVPSSASGSFAVISRGRASVDLIVTETVADYSALLATPWTADSLLETLSEPDRNAPQGIWTYLDRDNDQRYCRLGGEYNIAIVDDNNGGFDIIYLDGATTGASQWNTGMRKGHLRPTMFRNHYDLVWYDATMNVIQSEASATMEQDAILRLDFPLLKSSMRFSRCGDINSALQDR